MNTIVIEEHSVDTVTRSQHSLREIKGRQAGLTGIGSAVDDNGEIHRLADTKKPRHETHGRACLTLNTLIVTKPYKMQEGREKVKDTKVERNGCHDIIGFATVDDTACIKQNET